MNITIQHFESLNEDDFKPLMYEGEEIEEDSSESNEDEEKEEASSERNNDEENEASSENNGHEKEI